MNFEKFKGKKSTEKKNPEIEKWLKLVDKTGLHPREEVIERWVKFNMAFDEDEHKVMEKHFNICEKCAKKRDNEYPLLQEIEKAS